MDVISLWGALIEQELDKKHFLVGKNTEMSFLDKNFILLMLAVGFKHTTLGHSVVDFTVM